MFYGPDTIFQCIGCGNLVARPTLWSGSDNGKLVYSDTNVWTPMILKYPQVVNCKKCGRVLWLNKMEGFSSIEWEKIYKNTDSDKKQFAEFLNIKEYFSILENNENLTTKDEIFIRTRIIWEYNDRVRTEKEQYESIPYLLKRRYRGHERVRTEEEQFESVSDKLLWSENVECLKKLLHNKKGDSKMLLADLYRYTLDFDISNEIISSIVNPKYKRIKTQFKDEIKKKNRLVFQLIND